MNKPAKPSVQPDGAFDDLMSEADCEAQFDAWLERNRDALVASLDEAQAEFDRGEYDERSFDEIIAEGIRRLNHKP
ncbi:hypothetical protein OVA11_16920 [Caulobacter sp. SL161]|uniref:hypothetical protein n=1 Tax=Caulobacter sp. SL161 TaxID=2995156 RepID=UPI002276B3F1|nr:hypothetical protein [Caulobacter sp. SL161]MCY1648682.1 hypothetical protein [Caulobacter sp. SL161]